MRGTHRRYDRAGGGLTSGDLQRNPVQGWIARTVGTRDRELVRPGNAQQRGVDSGERLRRAEHVERQQTILRHAARSGQKVQQIARRKILADELKDCARPDGNCRREHPDKHRAVWLGPGDGDLRAGLRTLAPRSRKKNCVRARRRIRKGHCRLRRADDCRREGNRGLLSGTERKRVAGKKIRSKERDVDDAAVTGKAAGEAEESVGQACCAGAMVSVSALDVPHWPGPVTLIL